MSQSDSPQRKEEFQLKEESILNRTQTGNSKCQYTGLGFLDLEKQSKTKRMHTHTQAHTPQYPSDAKKGITIFKT